MNAKEATALSAKCRKEIEEKNLKYAKEHFEFRIKEIEKACESGSNRCESHIGTIKPCNENAISKYYNSLGYTVAFNRPNMMMIEWPVTPEWKPPAVGAPEDWHKINPNPVPPGCASPGLFISDKGVILIRTHYGENSEHKKPEWVNLEGTFGFTPDIVYRVSDRVIQDLSTELHSETL